MLCEMSNGSRELLYDRICMRYGGHETTRWGPKDVDVKRYMLDVLEPVRYCRLDVRRWMSDVIQQLLGGR